MFSSIKLIAILGIVSVLGGGIWHVTGLKADLAVSRGNVDKLTDAVDLQRDTITEIYLDQEKIRTANNQLAQRIRLQDKELKDLRDRFEVTATGQDRDFANLLIKKPGLMENIINNGTANAIRCLELSSGAKLTEAELGATTRVEINNECPSLANPNYQPGTN